MQCNVQWSMCGEVFSIVFSVRCGIQCAVFGSAVFSVHCSVCSWVFSVQYSFQFTETKTKNPFMTQGSCRHRESSLNHAPATWFCGCPTLLGLWIPLLIGWLLIKPFHWPPLASHITLTPMQSSREVWIYLEIDLVPCYLVSLCSKIWARHNKRP